MQWEQKKNKTDADAVNTKFVLGFVRIMSQVIQECWKQKWNIRKSMKQFNKSFVPEDKVELLSKKKNPIKKEKHETFVRLLPAWWSMADVNSNWGS